MDRIPFLLRVALALVCTITVPTTLLDAQSDPDAVGSLLEVDTGVVQNLAFDLEPVSAVVTVDVEVESGLFLTVEMRPHSNRADDFAVLVDDGSGSLTPVPAPPIQTFRGHVVGAPGTRVRASFNGETMNAIIWTLNETYAVEPTRRVIPSAPVSEHFAYVTKAWTGSIECGVLDTVSATPGGSGSSGATPAGPTSTITLTDIALEADFEYYELCGSSVAETTLDMEDILNSVEGIYEVQMGIAYEISRVIVRLASGLYPSNNGSDRLNQFGANWSSAPEAGITRDVAHLFTGRTLNAGVLGVAAIASICNSNAYGLSVDKQPGSYAGRVAVPAHELGHNWAANHCNSSSDCRIMCASLGGCGSIDTFGPNAVNVITSFRDSRPCLVFEVDPQPLPFFEDWASLLIDSTRWTFTSGVGVTSGAQAEPSLPYTLSLNASSDSVFADDEIRSSRLLLSGTSNPTFAYYERASNVPAGLELIVEFRDANLEWIPLETVVSTGNDPDQFTLHAVPLPPEALHDEFRFRFRVDVDAPSQNWFIDNISVTEGLPPALEAPIVSNVSPSTGSTSGGTPILVTGENFLPDASVTIGGIPAVDLVYIDHFSLLATTPAGASGLSTIAITQSGLSGLLVNGFIYSDNSLALSAEQVPLGESVDVTAFATNDVTLAGFSLACSFDGTHLDVSTISVDGTDANGADFAFSNFSNDPGDSWWTLGVVLDLTPPLDTVLTPGSARPIARVTFATEPSAAVGTTVPLILQSGVGNPPVDLIFSIDGGTSSVPSTANGSVQITEVGFIRGDGNGDGAVDIADPVANLGFLFSGATADCPDALDTNDDGVINIADPVYNLSFQFSSGPEPPQPFPTAGADPTSDGLGCTP